jgi:hypothetical protein
MNAGSISIVFQPAALDYVYRKLQLCPHAEVHALLVDIETQVKQQQEPPLPVITDPATSTD